MAVYVRSVERGILSVSLGDAKLVQGPKGDTGNGIASAVLNGDYTLTLNFTDGSSYTIPSIRGAQGIQGEKGETGDTGTEGKTGPKGDTGNGIASAILNSDYTLTLNFTDGTTYQTPSIRGAQGQQGVQGESGPDGAAATVTVGTVNTGAPGTQAQVTNSGTENEAILNFTIPRGDTGAAGAGSGDMLAGTYDPMGKAEDIFAYADSTVSIHNQSNLAHGDIRDDLAEKLDSSDFTAHTGNADIHFTSSERTKLTDIEEEANHYVHPANHPASMITEDSTHRFTSDTEKAAWNAKQTALTFDSTPAEDSTNPVTSGGVYAALNAHNQAAFTITAGTFAGQVVANASGQAVGTSLLRNSKLVSTETTPTVNGEICWTYQ